MSNDLVKLLESKISFYRREEEHARAKAEESRRFRELIEQILKEHRGANNDKLTPSPTPVTTLKLGKGINVVKDIMSAADTIMSNGQDWKAADLKKEIQKKLGRTFANTTFRNALKAHSKIKRTSLGQYCLTPEG